MAYLILSNPTTNSCDFEVQLSNPFNTTYYQRLRITSTNYGSSTSSVSSYVENRTAGSSSSRYVTGIVNDGMSAGNTYTLYAYAQAQNGTWYLAGSDTITMEDNADGDVDLGMSSITTPNHTEPFNVGEEIKFKIKVRNYESTTSPNYSVAVYDGGTRLDIDTEPALDAGDYEYAYLYVTMNEPGDHQLKFVIEMNSSDTDPSDNVDYNTYTWESAIQSLLRIKMYTTL